MTKPAKIKPRKRVGAPAVEPQELQGDFSAATAAETIRKIIQSELARVTGAARGLSSQQRRLTLATLVSLVERLGKVTGETLHVDESRFVKSQVWHRLREVIVEALRAHPAAGAEVARALRGMEGGGG